MQFHEFGEPTHPHILLIHGGGNSWWNYLRQARVLAEDYHVILPTLDGHGEEWEKEYISTEDSADKILAYIDEHCGGHLFALSGISLGAQIVTEILSRRKDIAKKAIIESGLCFPCPFMAWYCKLTVKLFGKIIFGEKACKWQIDMMPKLVPEKMLYPEEIKNYYITDMPKTPLKTLITIYNTYMSNYQLKDSLRETQADVMYWYGGKEMKAIKRSALMFKEYVPSCQIYEAKGYNHGYLSIYLPEEWLALAIPFFQ